jgi:hypothetical protein
MIKFLNKMVTNKNTWIKLIAILAIVMGIGMILGVTFPTWYLVTSAIFIFIAAFIYTKIDREERIN